MRRLAPLCVVLVALFGDVSPSGHARHQSRSAGFLCDSSGPYPNWSLARPAWSRDSRWIAHVQHRSGRSVVVSVPARGGGRRILLSKPESLSLRWSPRGSRMIVYEYEEMYLAGPGLTTRWIGSGCFGAWAPDGKRIAYSADGRIYTARPDGSDRRVVSQGDQVHDWSPDGERIAFVRHLETPGCVAPMPRLFVLHLRSRRVVRVTNHVRIEEDGVEHQRGVQTFARFSPDSRRLSFAERRPCDYPYPLPMYETYAQVVEVQSLRLRSVGRGWPVWSPAHSRLGVFAALSNRLTVVGPTGRQIGSFEVFRDFSWAPDGNRIVHSWSHRYPYRPLSEDLYILALGGTGPGRPLADGGVVPTWSPDGRQIAFARYDSTCRGAPQGSRGAVHVIEVASRRTRRVIDCWPL